MTNIERQVERIAGIWTIPRMSSFTKKEYALAFADFDPDHIASAVNSVRDTWMKDVVPPPGEFVSKCIAARTAARAANPTRREGDGVGCPHCRAEYPAGQHAYWAGDGTLIACQEHNTMWRGSTHQPDDQPDPGDFLPGEWRDHALAGDYGETIRQVAEHGGGPGDVIPALTPIPLDQALRDVTATHQ